MKEFESLPNMMKIKSKYAIQEMFSVINQLLLKMLKISLKIYQITKRLEEKYLLTFLNNLDLLIKC